MALQTNMLGDFYFCLVPLATYKCPSSTGFSIGGSLVPSQVLKHELNQFLGQCSPISQLLHGTSPTFSGNFLSILTVKTKSAKYKVNALIFALSLQPYPCIVNEYPISALP